jgi:hypothetical protein
MRALYTQLPEFSSPIDHNDGNMVDLLHPESQVTPEHQADNGAEEKVF